MGYGATCLVCGKKKHRGMCDKERPFYETVEFRGKRWRVAESQYDESGLGIGSHWHLTLTALDASPDSPGED